MPIKSRHYQPAERKATALRAILYGTDGSGKTYTALRLMRHLVGENGDILVLDTEQVGEDAPRSGQYDQFQHYVDPMPMREILAQPKTAYSRFMKRVEAAVNSGAEGVIIDSWSDENVAYMTHATAIGDDRAYYKTVRQMRTLLNEIIKNAPCHIILCQRARDKGVWSDGGERGKARLIRMAEQPEGSDAIGYAINLRFAMENIQARVVKTTYSDILPPDAVYDMATDWEAFADKIVTALDDGAVTKERFKMALNALGFPQSKWRQLWQALPDLGDWSPERHADMLQMVTNHVNQPDAAETGEPNANPASQPPKKTPQAVETT